MAPAGAHARKSKRIVPLVIGLLLVIAGVTVALVLTRSSASTPPQSLKASSSAKHSTKKTSHSTVTTTTQATGTNTSTSHATTTAPPAPTTTAPTTLALPAPAPGFVAGHITAVGDSVMIDYQDPLQTDIPGVSVQAAVSRQWSEGESILQQMKASGQLGAEVIVALGTNGPISAADFDNMMAILSGASRVVFVNTHVDRPWQDPNNAVIAAGVTRYPNVYVADWATLAAQNPGWFGADGTHLAIDGPGADALANLITSTLTNG